MGNVIYGGVVAVPLIVGLVEVAKRSGWPVRWAPPLALSLGVGLRLSYLLAADPSTPQSAVDALVQGLALGLAASGLYSGTRAIAGERESGRAGERVQASMGASVPGGREAEE
jgi:hypothetical protein